MIGWCCTTSILLQIAKAQGAFVASTCGTHNVEFVKGLGADRPIDYKKERCVQRLLSADMGAPCCCGLQVADAAASSSKHDGTYCCHATELVRRNSGVPYAPVICKVCSLGELTCAMLCNSCESLVARDRVLLVRPAKQPTVGFLPVLGLPACRFEDVFPGTPYDLVVDTMGGDYELRR